jgi:hypothetical protein
MMIRRRPEPPIFVVSGANKYAPGVVRNWAVVSQKNGTATKAEIEDAYQIAAEMETWYDLHGGERT